MSIYCKVTKSHFLEDYINKYPMELRLHGTSLKDVDQKTTEVKTIIPWIPTMCLGIMIGASQYHFYINLMTVFLFLLCSAGDWTQDLTC